jgi:hypothetical protein
MLKRSLILVALFAGLAGPVEACPMCKDSLGNSQGATELTDSYTSSGGASAGMNRSIYVMLGILFGTIGLVSTVIVRGIRSSDRNHGDPR